MMKVYVRKDNACALILARKLPQTFTPSSKYYATKMIWFFEETNKRKIVLLKTATPEQLVYLFTESLPITTFEYLWNIVMGL